MKKTTLQLTTDDTDRLKQLSKLYGNIRLETLVSFIITKEYIENVKKTAIMQPKYEDSLLGVDIRSFIFTSEQKARDFIDKCERILNDYGFVTVGDAKSLLHMDVIYDDYLCGWYTLDGFLIKIEAEGYSVNPPIAVYSEFDS